MVQELQEYEDALEWCRNHYSSILDKMEELEKEPIIKEYKRLQINLTNLLQGYEKLKNEHKKIYQTLCEHPLWYFMKDETDKLDNNQEFACRCIRCGIIKTSNSEDFKDNLIKSSEKAENSKKCFPGYFAVNKEYLELESSGRDKKDIAKALIKKYNIKK